MHVYYPLYTDEWYVLCDYRILINLIQINIDFQYLGVLGYCFDKGKKAKE